MIKSTQNTRIKEITKLKHKKYRDREERFVVEGEHLVHEAQKVGIIDTILAITPHKAYPQALIITETIMKKVVDAQSIPRIIAVCKKYHRDELVNKVLLLENIQDPGNFGTLLRTALAFGFKTIVLDDTVDLYHPKVLRSTQGALFHLSFLWMTPQEFKAKNPQYTLIATDVKQGNTPKQLQPPFVLMLGNEGTGLKASTLDLADQTYTIRTETVDSLNVAVAGSIIMHELTDST